MHTLLFISTATYMLQCGAVSNPREEEQLASLAELAESVGDRATAMARLEELRKFCSAKHPPCQRTDSDLLEQIGWLCVDIPQCKEKRGVELLVEIAVRLPDKTDLLNALKVERSEAEAPSDPEISDLPSLKQIPALRKAVAQHANDFALRDELVDLLVDRKMFGEALEELKICTTLRPKQARYHLLLAEVLSEVRRPQAAYKELSIYLQMQPKDWKAREFAINLLGDQKRIAERDQAILALIKAEPKRGLGFAFLAENALEQENLTLAKQALARAKIATSTDIESKDRISYVEHKLNQTLEHNAWIFVRDLRRSDVDDDLHYGGEIE